MSTYGFSEGDAKRIGRTVRLMETFPDKLKNVGPDAGRAVPGVRLLLAQHSGDPWPTLQTAVVTVYSGNPCEYPSCTDRPFSAYFTMVAVNHYTEYYDAVNEEVRPRWISLGHNGFGWTPVDSQNTDVSCLNEAGGVDFRIFPNWDDARQQFLGHDDAGCIRWYNVFSCATAAESPGDEYS